MAFSVSIDTLFLDRTSTQCQNRQMTHPIITFTGYAIALSMSVYVGMVIGYSIELERASAPRPLWYLLPTPDAAPSPEIFRGVG